MGVAAEVVVMMISEQLLCMVAQSVNSFKTALKKTDLFTANVQLSF